MHHSSPNASEILDSEESLIKDSIEASEELSEVQAKHAVSFNQEVGESEPFITSTTATQQFQAHLANIDDQTLRGIVKVQAIQRGRSTRRPHQHGSLRKQQAAEELLSPANAAPQLPALELPRLGKQAVDELRFLAYMMPKGQRPRSETRRILELLLTLPAFQQLLAGLPPEARLAALETAWPKYYSRGSVVQPAGHELQQQVQTLSHSKGAAVILQGELALHLVDSESGDQSVMIDSFERGSQVTSDVADSARLPEAARHRYRLEVLASTAVEVLALPAGLVARQEQIQRRESAVEALMQAEPWSRSKKIVQTMVAHLQHVDCFQGISEAGMDEICQQATLCTVASGGPILSAGDSPVGLRVIMSGHAHVWTPGPFRALAAAGTALHEQGRHGDVLAELHPDDACGEWEMCLPGKSVVYEKDVVASTPCKVMCVSRALYARHLLKCRCAQVLRASLIECLGGMDGRDRPQLQLQADRRRDSYGGAERRNIVAKFRRGVNRLSTVLAFRVQTQVTPKAKVPSFTGVPVAALDALVTAGKAEGAQFPVLEQFPHITRKALCGHMRLWHAHAGEVICHAGDLASALIVVVTGELALFEAPPARQKDGIPVEASHQPFTGSSSTALLLQEQIRVGAHEVALLARAGLAADTLEAHQSDGGSGDEDSCLVPIKRSPEGSLCLKLATACLHSAARRGLALEVPPLLHPKSREKDGAVTKEFVAAPRTFLQSSAADVAVWQRALEEPPSDRACQLDVTSLGAWNGNVGQGTPVCGLAFAAEKGDTSRPEVNASRRCKHTAVVLSPCADLLVLDHDIAGLVLKRTAAGLPRGAEAATILTSHPSGDYSAADLVVLEGLIRRHLPFESLEHRERAELCRSMSLRKAEEGELLCVQGTPATEFVMVLTGHADVYMAASLNNTRATEGDQMNADYGEFLFTAKEGAVFSEKALLSSSATHCVTIIARGEVTLVTLHNEDYVRVTKDWNGDKVLRRKTLGAFRIAGRGAGYHSELPDAVAEIVAQAMRGMSAHFTACSLSSRISVARHVQCLHVQAGERVFCGFDTPAGYPLCLVLSGCVGWYDGTEEENVSGKRRKMEIQREAKARTAAQQALQEQANLQAAKQVTGFGVQKQLQQTEQAIAKIQAVVQANPLASELSDTLRLHALQKKAKMLTAKLQEQQVAVPSRASEAPRVPSGQRFPPIALRSTSKDSASELDEDDEEEDDVLRLRACVAEFREGEVFGGWPEVHNESVWMPEMSPPSQKTQAIDSLGYQLSLQDGYFKAHTETSLLVLTRKGSDLAAKESAAQDAAKRVAFLRRWLPANIDQRLIDRLLKHSHMEQRPKGSVLVKAGQHPSFVWMIVDGSCQCFAPPSKGVALQSFTGLSGDEEGSPLQSSPAGNPPVTQMAMRLSSTAQQSLGILDQGQFAGLASALWQLPEPLTVTVNSASAELLAIPRSELLSRLPTECIEAMREQVRARSEWHLQRCENMASVPIAVAERMGQMRDEVHDLQVARVMDSPFLRRFQTQGPEGLERLNAVCERFGGCPHPESDWVHSWQDVEFYHYMRLKDVGGPLQEEAASDELPAESRAANLRFARFHGISRKLRELSASNQYLAAAVLPSKQLEAHEGSALLPMMLEDEDEADGRHRSPTPGDPRNRSKSPVARGRSKSAGGEDAHRSRSPDAHQRQASSSPVRLSLPLDGGVKLTLHSKVFATTHGRSKILREWDAQYDGGQTDPTRPRGMHPERVQHEGHRKARSPQKKRRQRSSDDEDGIHHGHPRSHRQQSPPPAPPPPPPRRNSQPPLPGSYELAKQHITGKQVAAATPVKKFYPPRIRQIGFNPKASDAAVGAYARIAYECQQVTPPVRPPPVARMRTIISSGETCVGQNERSARLRRELVADVPKLEVCACAGGDGLSPMSPSQSLANLRSSQPQTGRAPLRSSVFANAEDQIVDSLQVGEAKPPPTRRKSSYTRRGPHRSSNPATPRVDTPAGTSDAFSARESATTTERLTSTMGQVPTPRDAAPEPGNAGSTETDSGTAVSSGEVAELL